MMMECNTVYCSGCRGISRSLRLFTTLYKVIDAGQVLKRPSRATFAASSGGVRLFALRMSVRRLFVSLREPGKNDARSDRSSTGASNAQANIAVCVPGLDASPAEVELTRRPRRICTTGEIDNMGGRRVGRMVRCGALRRERRRACQLSGGHRPLAGDPEDDPAKPRTRHNICIFPCDSSSTPPSRPSGQQVAGCLLRQPKSSPLVHTNDRSHPRTLEPEHAHA